MNDSAHRITAATGAVSSDSPTPSWGQINQVAPLLAATMQRYVEQIRVTLRPGTVRNVDSVLRRFAAFVTAVDIGTVTSVTDIERRHIEAYKRHIAGLPGIKGPGLASASIAHQLSALRMFFTRTIEWNWDDAPKRVLIYAGDYPPKDEPLPRAISDPDMAALLSAARTDTARPIVTVVVETLARTGLRVGEFCGLEADAIQTIDSAPWLRVPVGKLHNDRNIPLHGDVVAVIATYHQHTPPAAGRLVVDENNTPLSRHQITRILNRTTKRAGIGHITAHQLRHTLATQAINRGMRIEAIAALLGHRSYDMTRRYARVADRTVRTEYDNVTTTLDSLYNNPTRSPTATADHHRHLGNGWCTRPHQLACEYENICEKFGYYDTNNDFAAVLDAQRDDAKTKQQHDRCALFTNLLDDLNQETNP